MKNHHHGFVVRALSLVVLLSILRVQRSCFSLVNGLVIPLIYPAVFRQGRFRSLNYRKVAKLHINAFATDNDGSSSSSSGVPSHPNSDLNAVDVVTLCMNALSTQKPNQSLELCFVFSSDRCRSAVGGTLENFIEHASNPIFGALVHCQDYSILSVGPIIPGGTHRGEMQTVLIEIQKGVTVNDAIEMATKRNVKKRPTIAERLRQRERMMNTARPNNNYYNGDDEDERENNGKMKFLWTLQKERRPPRQNCWLVYEVLFIKNAFQQTM